jgi:hypothetical protein
MRAAELSKWWDFRKNTLFFLIWKVHQEANGRHKARPVWYSHLWIVQSPCPSPLRGSHYTLTRGTWPVTPGPARLDSEVECSSSSSLLPSYRRSRRHTKGCGAVSGCIPTAYASHITALHSPSTPPLPKLSLPAHHAWDSAILSDSLWAYLPPNSIPKVFFFFFFFFFFCVSWV